MSQHLSRKIVQRYRLQSLRTSELIAATDHLAICAECREMLLGSAGDVETRVKCVQREFVVSADSDHATYVELARYVDRELSASRRAALDAHFQDCRTCAEELQDLESYALDFTVNSRTPDRLLQGRGASAEISMQAVPRKVKRNSGRSADWISQVESRRWQLCVCWAAMATLTALVVPLLMNTWVSGPVIAIWVFTIVTEIFAVSFSVIRKIFFRYFLLNLYWILSIAVEVSRFSILSSFGLSSPQYLYWYFYTDCVLTVVLFCAVVQLIIRIISTKVSDSRAICLAASAFFVGTVFFSFLVVEQSSAPLFTHFVVDLSQNLFVVITGFTLAVWAWRLFRDSVDRIADRLVTVLGCLFLVSMLEYGIRNLYPPDKIPFLTIFNMEFFNMGYLIAACSVLLFARSTREGSEARQPFANRPEALDHGK
jgi:hypothetical protein